jgi:hypothetical protein
MKHIISLKHPVKFHCLHHLPELVEHPDFMFSKETDNEVAIVQNDLRVDVVKFVSLSQTKISVLVQLLKVGLKLT